MKGITKVGVLAILACALVVACGKTGTAGVSAFSKGVITAKGSIFVNGVEFDLSGASIQIDGATGTEADLRVGMAVAVKGRIDDSSKTGTAAAVHFDGSLKGPISAIAAPNITVLGQTVVTDTNTVFESLAGIGALAVNDVVEVTGFPDAAGRILATHIEKTGSSTYEIIGNVTGTPPTTATGSFVLTPPNGGTALTVDFTGGPLAADIQNGAQVEVKFSTFNSGTLTITTTAGSVETKTELEPAEGERVEVEGFVTNLSASTFMVEGTTVNAGSLSLAGISNGTKVEVEGTFTSNTLFAEQIQVK